MCAHLNFKRLACSCVFAQDICLLCLVHFSYVFLVGVHICVQHSKPQRAPERLRRQSDSAGWESVRVPGSTAAGSVRPCAQVLPKDENRARGGARVGQWSWGETQLVAAGGWRVEQVHQEGQGIAGHIPRQDQPAVVQTADRLACKVRHIMLLNFIKLFWYAIFGFGLLNYIKKLFHPMHDRSILICIK